MKQPALGLHQFWPIFRHFSLFEASLSYFDGTQAQMKQRGPE
jgi:hypothetical protein